MPASYLIVGGSSDIAILLAKRLLKDQHNVTVLARDIARCSEIQELGAEIIQGDALNPSAVSAAVDATQARGNGSIAGVAHLVGSLLIRPPHAVKIDAFNEVIHTNLSTAFLTLSTACKAMLRSGGGRLVFISSIAASLGLVNHEAIAAAKGGIESMVRSAAATYSQRNIRVNAVAPGLTETRLAENILKSDVIREAAVGMIPLKRINQPDEIASTVEWLLCDAPDNLTGQILNLDGGMSNLRN
ncbi:MAG: SDR family oxidoreductase [archaeon]|jgi:NAD(P)-dependent dehydrogenase (short-subunit alcohol dehydrogenase family)|nr:SDR family oxidoreductase [archaeon]MDA1131149.1 SDR family oxidoreductase [archaeon]